MSNAIQYLEVLGRNPTLALLPPTACAELMSAFDVEPPQRQALLARDGHRLNALLGGRSEMKCLIFSPDDQN